MTEGSGQPPVERIGKKPAILGFERKSFCEGHKPPNQWAKRAGLVHGMRMTSLGVNPVAAFVQVASVRFLNVSRVGKQYTQQLLGGIRAVDLALIPQLDQTRKGA